MDPHDTNRLVAVTFEPEESPSPPQTPRRLRPQRESSAVIAHKIQVDAEERKFAHETTWRSCCLTVDKRALLYFGQMGVGILIIGFCIAMLATDDSCDSFARYSPLLTLVVGIMLPAPKLHD
jgi:hypothetical protein